MMALFELQSFVWNEGVAKTTTIIGSWLVAAGGSAWLLGMLCNSLFGNPIIGYIAGMLIGVVGVVTTID